MLNGFVQGSIEQRGPRGGIEDTGSEEEFNKVLEFVGNYSAVLPFRGLRVQNEARDGPPKPKRLLWLLPGDPTDTKPSSGC